MSNEYLDIVKDVIQEVESIDSINPLAYEKAMLAFLRIKKHPWSISILEKGWSIFRTRTHSSDNYFSLIDDITSPPPGLVKSFARCNRPYQSIFYASENRPTSYLELINTWANTSKHGDKVIVSIGEWELLEEMHGVVILSPFKHERVSDFERHHGERFDSFLDQQEPAIKEASIVFYDYINKKFKAIAYSDLKTYIITSAFSNVALQRTSSMACCIIYPSVPYKGKGINYAIRSDYVNRMKLKNVLRNTFEVKDNAIGKFDFNEIEAVNSTRIDQSTLEIHYK